MYFNESVKETFAFMNICTEICAYYTKNLFMYIVNIKGLIILSLKLYIQNLSANFALELPEDFLLFQYFLTGALNRGNIPEIPGTERIVKEGLQSFWQDDGELGLGKGGLEQN